MKRIVLILLLLPFISQAQKMPGNGFDKLRIAQADKIIHAEILPVKFHPATKPELSYYWHRANVIHITKGGFSGKLLNGSYTEYYLNKNLKEQGTFTKGLKSGVWKNWSDTGNLLSWYSWSDGVKMGPFIIYDEKGKLIQSGNYRNDQLNGKIRFYDSAGTLTVVQYNNGNIVPDNTRSFLQRINIFKKKPHTVRTDTSSRTP